MCYRNVTIAICALEHSPSPSFTCGKLHPVAASDHVCANAQGDCVCFLGTCGHMREVHEAAGIDLAAVKKVRCLECTKKEDHLGEERSQRERIESPLLVKGPILTDHLDKFLEILRTIWGDERECPFHGTLESPASAIEAQNGAAKQNGHLNGANGRASSMSEIKIERQDSPDARVATPLPAPDSTPARLPLSEKAPNLAPHEQKAVKVTTADPENMLKVESGLSASRWSPENRLVGAPVTPRPSRLVPKPTGMSSERKSIPGLSLAKAFLER